MTKLTAPPPISLTEFLASPTTRIDEWRQVSESLAGGRLRLDFLSRFRAKHLPTVCFMPSAQPRGNRKNPVYNRWAWADELSEFNVLVLSEPTLYADETILAGWLVDRDQDLTKVISQELGRILKEWEVKTEHFLLYGSSMGGFEALSVATVMEGSSCIAEVPQIDLYQYQFPEALESIEQHILQASLIRHRRLHPEQFSVGARMRHEGQVPNALIITNRADDQFGEVVKLIEQASPRDDTSGFLSMHVWPEAHGHRPITRTQAIPFIKAWAAYASSKELDATKNFKGKPAITRDELFDMSNSYTVALSQKYTFAELRKKASALSDSVEMTRDAEDASRYREAVHHLLAASIVDKRQDWSLLRACSLIKRWELAFGPNLLELAQRAFERKHSEGALSYMCRGILANYDHAEIETKFDELRFQLEDEDLISLLGIFESIAIYDRGDLEGYEQRVRELRGSISPNFDTYLLTPLSTVVLDEDLGYSQAQELQKRLEDGLDHFRNLSSLRDADYTAVTSCDPVYLEVFGEYLVQSFDISTTSSAKLVIFVLGDKSSLQDLTAHLRTISDKVDFFFAHVALGENLAPGSSLLRFLPVANILDSTNQPVVLMDIDAVVVDDLSNLIKAGEGYDLALRQLGQKVAPWERYAAGVVVFYPTDIGFFIAKMVQRAGVRVLSPGKKQWWIDQNILEYGIRTANKECSKAPRIKSLMSMTRKSLVLPTGQRATKIKILAAALGKLKA